MDVTEILDRFAIQYKLSGKNVGRNYVGVDCPWCDDVSNHLGINIYSGQLNCFRCGPHGYFVNLFKKLRIPNYWKHIPETISFEKFEPSYDVSEIKRTYDNAYSTASEIYMEYIEARKFPIDTVRKFRLRFGKDYGDFKYRILIPYFHHGQFVGMTGRTVVDSGIKYLTGKTPIHDYLYNYDSCREVCIVVEGPTDVWKIGDGCVALSGKMCSAAQFCLLKQFRKVYIMLDEDAQVHAEKLSSDLCLFTDVAIIKIKGDPGELSENDVQYLRREIF